MDVYKSIVDYISNQPAVKVWADVETLLKFAASKQPRDWRLPLLACEATGGTNEQALPAAAALACAQIGIILIDDMLDDDPRGEYRKIGMAQTSNFAASFFSLGQNAILRSRAQPAIKLAAMNNLNNMTLTVSYGQYLDSQNPQDEAAYWNVAKTKSGAFFGTAFLLGALFGGASTDVAKEVEKLGQLYGEMIQIHDDLKDTMSEPANPDWLQGRSTLPVLFAQFVEHPEQARFRELQKDISDLSALHEAQSILIRCGAVSYCVDQLLRRHQVAAEILKTTSLRKLGLVEGPFDDLVAPVHRLLDAITMP